MALSVRFADSYAYNQYLVAIYKIDVQLRSNLPFAHFEGVLTTQPH